MKKIILFASLLVFAVTSAFAGTAAGKLTDKQTGEPLIGANIVVMGTTTGTTSSDHGDFALTSLPPGEYKIKISYIGYQTVEQTVTVGATDQALNLALTPLILTSDIITVVASRARAQETPVAFMDIEKLQLREKSGSRDFPLILDAVPGVYGTEGSGEMGASRVNIRGFDFKNIAMMINGLPVNDVESGFQYWSNWDNLTDVTSSVQVQRGFGASNMAVFSVGGTINILTDPTQLQRSLSFRQEYGAGTYLKSLLNFNSGLIDNKFAASISLTKKDGFGVLDQAWVDEYSYYAALSYNVGRKHRVELSASARHNLMASVFSHRMSARLIRTLRSTSTATMALGLMLLPRWKMLWTLDEDTILPGAPSSISTNPGCGNTTTARCMNFRIARSTWMAINKAATS